MQLLLLFLGFQFLLYMVVKAVGYALPKRKAQPALPTPTPDDRSSLEQFRRLCLGK